MSPNGLHLVCSCRWAYGMHIADVLEQCISEQQSVNGHLWQHCRTRHNAASICPLQSRRGIFSDHQHRESQSRSCGRHGNAMTLQWQATLHGHSCQLASKVASSIAALLNAPHWARGCRHSGRARPRQYPLVPNASFQVKHSTICSFSSGIELACPSLVYHFSIPLQHKRQSYSIGSSMHYPTNSLISYRSPGTAAAPTYPTPRFCALQTTLSAGAEPCHAFPIYPNVTVSMRQLLSPKQIVTLS